jgi:hypothetical protein
VRISDGRCRLSFGVVDDVACPLLAVEETEGLWCKGSGCQPREAGCGGRKRGSSNWILRSFSRSSAVSAIAVFDRWVSEKSATLVVRDAAE